MLDEGDVNVHTPISANGTVSMNEHDDNSNMTSQSSSRAVGSPTPTLIVASLDVTMNINSNTTSNINNISMDRANSKLVDTPLSVDLASSSSSTSSSAVSSDVGALAGSSSASSNGLHSSLCGVGGYELGGVLGVGTYGEVRLARSVLTGQRYAVKLVDLSRFNDETVQLIRREIKILSLLHHKHCIRLHEVKEQVPYQGTWCESCACSSCTGRDEEGCCSSCHHSAECHTSPSVRNVLMIVQELAAGGELYGVLAQTGALTEEVARFYFRQLISAVDHCHKHGVIHRDLKPENLVLDPYFNLKLVDFGLASIVGPSPPPSHHTNPPHLPLHHHRDPCLTVHVDPKSTVSLLHSGVGSQPYSAPEVYYAKELYGGRGYDGAAADIWSCAVILFVMLTGRPPFARPLSKTFNSQMKRCRHFVSLMKGTAYGGMSESAALMLSSMFKLESSERTTISQVMQSDWFNGPVPSTEQINNIMLHRANKVWATLHKQEMIDVLDIMRRNPPMLSPTPSPSTSPSSSPSPSPQPFPTSSPSDKLDPHHSIKPTTLSSSAATPTRNSVSYGLCGTAFMSPGTSPFCASVTNLLPISPSLTSANDSPSISCPTSPAFLNHHNHSPAPMHVFTSFNPPHPHDLSLSPNTTLSQPHAHVHTEVAHAMHAAEPQNIMMMMMMNNNANLSNAANANTDGNNGRNNNSSGSNASSNSNSPFIGGISDFSMLSLADQHTSDNHPVTRNHHLVADDHHHDHDDDDDDDETKLMPLNLTREPFLHIRTRQRHRLPATKSAPSASSAVASSSSSSSPSTSRRQKCVVVSCRSVVQLLSCLQTTLTNYRFSCSVSSNHSDSSHSHSHSRNSNRLDNKDDDMQHFFIQTDGIVLPSCSSSSSSSRSSRDDNDCNKCDDDDDINSNDSKHKRKNGGEDDGKLKMGVRLEKMERPQAQNKTKHKSQANHNQTLDRRQKTWKLVLTKQHGSDAAFGLMCKRIARAATACSMPSVAEK